MTVLIIGSEGFIGKFICQQFITSGHSVIGCDLLDSRNAEYAYYKISRLSPEYHDIFQKEKIDICVNAAGNGSVPVSIKNPLNDFEANCVDSFKILECIRTLSPGTSYLYISSAAVYGNPSRLPIKECDDIMPMSPYGWHKYYGELMCREYFTLYKIRTCIVRPFSVYGPGLRKQLLWDLFIKSKKSKGIEVFGTGSETRDFIFIDDLACAIYLIVNKAEFVGEVFNIARGIETAISDVVSTYIDALDENIKFSFNKLSREGDPKNWLADITKLKHLGFSSSVTLREGIAKTVKWQKEHGLE